MSTEAGSIVEGKVTGITKFGAFVSLPDGKSGLIHISEIANTYVNDVNEHLSVGQSVKALVMSVSPDGKIALSAKRALPPPETKPNRNTFRSSATPEKPTASDSGDFEDRLKRFMQESDSRIADNKYYADHRQRNRRR